MTVTILVMRRGVTLTGQRLRDCHDRLDIVAEDASRVLWRSATPSGDIEGSTDKLGDEWTYRYKDIHCSKQKVTELVPGKRVAWHVLDGYLDFVENKEEWTGTDITFDITNRGDKTDVRFTHLGLVPDFECFDNCSNAWGFYINGSLRSLISTGEGQPN